MSFPRTPQTGKNSKVYVNTSDGQLLNLEAMTKQASYTHNGEVFTNRVYKLAADQTLINMRAEKEPEAFIAGIIEGLEITPNGANDEIQTAAGSLVDADGTEVTVAADTSVAVTRPASSEFAWIAISVHMATGAMTATKGTDTTGGVIAGLLDTYGSAAGQRPLIPVTDLLVGLVQLDNGAADVLNSEIKYFDKEESGQGYVVLPNIGGVLVDRTLVVCHVGPIARTVKFTGYYYDEVMSLVGTAKDWTLTPSANQVTENTFTQNIAASEISGYGFTFNQLLTDSKAWYNTVDRQGYGAVRVVAANGYYWQGAATMVATINNATGSFANISVSGNMLDTPAEGDE